MSESATIQDLVTRALRGDEPARAALIRDLDPPLRRFIAGQVRGRTDVSVDEVLQDTRIYVLQRLDRYDATYPLLVFARGLAHNIVKRHLYRKHDVAPPDEESWQGDLTPRELERLPLAFRHVMGGDRFAEPGAEAAAPSRLFLETLELFFRHGGYPHQQIAFGFSVLVWGRAKKTRRTGARLEKVPVTGDPGRVVNEVGPHELQPSRLSLVDEIDAGCGLERAWLERVCEPLDARLRLQVADLFAADRASAREFEALRERQVGSTRLAEYFGKDPRRSVSDWTLAVRRRIRTAVAGSRRKVDARSRTHDATAGR
jgi:DNA-directed RNA polymerase specialized sigma24 family protein